jgi:hypothetical protein
MVFGGIVTDVQDAADDAVSEGSKEIPLPEERQWD